jgi:hypothetical protein
MVKRRDPQATISKSQPTQEQIEAFASGADGDVAMTSKTKRKLDPKAKHDFKAIRVPFNEYEYAILDEAAPKTGRTKLNFIRWAILKMADELKEK